MKKKVLSLLLVAIFSLSLFTACGGESNGEDANKPDENSEGSSEIAIDSAAGEGAEKLDMWVFVELHGKFYEKMVQKWNENNPDKQIELSITAYPYDDMHNKLQISLQSGTGAPDLCDIEIGKFPTFLKGEPQLEILNDVVEPYKDTVVQSRLEVYSKDGNIYGIPTHVGATVMFYNTEILEEADVDYTGIETWNDYRESGKKVVETTGKKMGVAETGALWTLSALLAQQGSDFTTDDGAPNVYTEEAIRAVSLVQEMLEEGILEVCPGGQPDTEEGFGYINEGNVASVLMPMWFMSRFTDYMPDLEGKIAIAPIPVFEKGMPRSVGLGGTGTVVTKTAKNVELAKEWLAYAKLSEEGNKEIWEVLGFDPVNTSLWEDKSVTHNPDNMYVQYFKTNPFDVLNEIKDEIQLIKSTEISPSINNLLCTETLNSLYEDGADPEETLKYAQEQLELEFE